MGLSYVMYVAQYHVGRIEKTLGIVKICGTRAIHCFIMFATNESVLLNTYWST